MAKKRKDSPDQNPPPRRWRGIGAIVAGFFTVLGGYVTARLAPENPMRHVLILGLIGFLAALAGLLGTWNRPEMGPRWYPVALVVTSLPCVWLGGKIHLARAGRSDQA